MSGSADPLVTSSGPFPNTGKTHLPIPSVLASCIAHRTTLDSQPKPSRTGRARLLRSICFHCTRIPFRAAHPAVSRSSSNKLQQALPDPETYLQFRRDCLAVSFARVGRPGISSSPTRPFYSVVSYAKRTSFTCEEPRFEYEPPTSQNTPSHLHALSSVS